MLFVTVVAIIATSAVVIAFLTLRLRPAGPGPEALFEEMRAVKDRLATLERCDTICVLDHGRVVELGAGDLAMDRQEAGSLLEGTEVVYVAIESPGEGLDGLLFVELHDVLGRKARGEVVRLEVVTEGDAQRPHQRSGSTYE